MCNIKSISSFIVNWIVTLTSVVLISICLLTTCYRTFAQTDEITLTSDQMNEIIRITAKGTPEELLSKINALKIKNISKVRFGRNHSLMHVAIGNESHPEIINVLNKLGGDINAQDDDLRTPLDYAVDNDTPKAARILLELGADPLLANGSGVHVLDSCRNVVLRDIPNHSTCNSILNFVGQ